MKRDRGNAAVSPRTKQPGWGSANEKEHLGIAICTRCAGVHREKRWTRDQLLHDSLQETRVDTTTCPACLMQQQGLIEGVVKVQAEWTPSQTDDAVRLARHEEEREALKNGLHRIVSLEASEHGLELTTTTEFLARHLSRHLERAYHGQRTIKQSPDEKFVEIQVTCMS